MTAEGFMVVDVVIAEVGPLPYEYQTETGDVIVRNEMLPAESIFDPDYIASCEGAPFVLSHPQDEQGKFVDVSPDNFKEVMKGVLTNPRVNEATGQLIGSLKIFDKEVQNLVINKVLSEVSGGYTCNVIPKSGTHNGEKFDAVQTGMNMNHLALVSEGRAGESVRILFNHKVNAKLREFIKRSEYEMKKSIATKKQNAADAAIKAANKAKIEADLATKAALKVNLEDTKVDDDKNNQDPEDLKGIDKNVITPEAKDTAAFVKNVEGNAGLNEVAQMLMKAAEALQGMMSPTEPQINAEDAAPAKVEEIKESLLNSADIKKMVFNNVIEQRKTYTLGASILGLEQAEIAATKFNTTDEFRRYCLLTTKFKKQNEVATMNSDTVTAYFEVLAETRQATINAPDMSRQNSVNGNDSNEQEMTLNEFVNV